VWLDGSKVEGARAETGAGLPAEFGPPAETPPLRPGQEKLTYKTEGGGALVFRVTLAPGPHTFVVRYAARPSAFSDTSTPEINWQLGYVLSPARRWESFGGLDAKVLLPEGWRAASEPALERQGDALVKSWDALPSDALALTFKTSEGTIFDYARFWKAQIVLGLIFAFAAGLAGWKMGTWLGGRRRTSAWALLLSPLVASALVVLAYYVAGLFGLPPAPEQAAFNHVGDYSGIVTFFLGLLSFVLHFVAAQTCAFVSRRRVVRRLR
jgi:hypothetical protein